MPWDKASIVVGQYDGILRLSIYRPVSSFPKGTHPYEPDTSLDRLLQMIEFGKGGRVVWVHVAHWFLILLFLIPWLGWLFWHGRRMKRLAASKN